MVKKYHLKQCMFNKMADLVVPIINLENVQHALYVTDIRAYNLSPGLLDLTTSIPPIMDAPYISAFAENGSHPGDVLHTDEANRRLIGTVVSRLNNGIQLLVRPSPLTPIEGLIGYHGVVVTLCPPPAPMP
jgi:hypothetical protein